MSFSSVARVAVMSSVAGSADTKHGVIRSHYNVCALTECSELMEVAVEQAQKEFEGAKETGFRFYAYDADGRVFASKDVDPEDFVTETSLFCDKMERSFDEFHHVTLSAKFHLDRPSKTERSVHHVHRDDEHVVDLSVVEGVTPEELEHCHQWGIYTAAHLRKALPLQLPERLRSFSGGFRIVSESKPLAQQAPLGDEVHMAFDLGVKMGHETRFMHTHAPLYQKRHDVLGVSFALDDQTVFIRDDHRAAVGDFVFTNPDAQGAIGTHLDLHHPTVELLLRHSDTFVFEQGHTHQPTHEVAKLDYAFLMGSKKRRCARGHTYKHTCEDLGDGWTLNKTVVTPHDSMASQLNLTMLQSADRNFLVYCSVYWRQDKHKALLDVGANAQGIPAIDTFVETFDTATIGLLWNGDVYERELAITWYFTNDYPSETTRFGDLYIQMRNILEGSEGSPAGLPSIVGVDQPDVIGIDMSWENDQGRTVRFKIADMRYEKILYAKAGDESGWVPYVVGTFGVVEEGSRRENFNPRSGDTNLRIVFDLGDSTDINARVGGQRITRPGVYRLKPTRVGAHTHTVEVTKQGDGRLGGVSTVGANHVHLVENGIVQPAAGHTHAWVPITTDSLNQA